MNYTMAPQVLRSSKTEAEILLPGLRVWLTFRCPSHCVPTHSHLTEVWRGHDKPFLEKHIELSAGTLLAAKKLAANAMAEKRAIQGERTWRDALQLCFKF